MEFITYSEKETIELGKKIGSKLEKAMVIVLTGELGSGKTKITEGILSYFGLEDEISSPTFTIVNEYDAKNLKIFHFDVYRLEEADEFYAIGGDEYFDKGASIIEWGMQLPEVLPKDYIEIKFSKFEDDENKRKLEIICNGNSKIEL